MSLEERIKEIIEDINSLGYKDKINLNSSEVAKVLGVSPSSIDNYRKQGIAIDYIELGGRYIYPKRALAEFLARNIIKTA
ncbi:helix-turn-helix domain-containing protein [Aliarcobacter butzleri]|uniref:Helix-turn-helix domain-containing protein n=2 Tax=Aliarcobacter butzleri TaxID=28197 RepID=A0AAP4PZ23_9BACT|nr:helix-turn-helix domain-containing protein [Aliarcobacter butzleri]KLD97825.1 hypothetical protein AA20_10295 [Aliarcobacter butzleri L348]MCG3661183.1 helix-turn-helix domain-containing protein [Aliarcobacter butzleri]MCG3678406.1 helix-turn-helix domain-containing protein [Aliarcobacter butzleri]MDN5052194.1 helix-turn-helix domain-containing protein [Aliarcobacter butzleri]MDN5063754.1 helix-turn-helix domain-containing protein [Aliarcobacter butzleri]